MSLPADRCPSHPSEQGQPVIFSAGGGGNGAELAGRYASGVIGAVFTIEDARNQREALREAARRAGREPDEVKFFAGVMPAIAATKRAGSGSPRGAGRTHRPGPCPVLGIDAGSRAWMSSQLDQPLTSSQLAAAQSQSLRSALHARP